MERNNGDYICLQCSRRLKNSGRNNTNCKYKGVDDNFYTDVDTEFKAYILGWIASDGTITKGSIKIEIKDVDEDIITTLRDNICPTLPITRRFNGSMNSVSLTINSIQISKDVCQLLNITPGKKSHSVCFPTTIPDDLKWHFIRGLFDGDGHIRKFKDNDRSRSCGIASVSENMRSNIRDFCGLQCHTKEDGITYTGTSASKFLYKMYENASFKMQRKYSIYMKYQEQYNFDGEKDNIIYGPNEKIIPLRAIKKTDGTIENFHSIISALRFIRSSYPSACSTNISSVIDMKNRSAYGYRWSVVN